MRSSDHFHLHYLLSIPDRPEQSTNTATVQKSMKGVLQRGSIALFGKSDSRCYASRQTVYLLVPDHHHQHYNYHYCFDFPSALSTLDVLVPRIER